MIVVKELHRHTSGCEEKKLNRNTKFFQPASDNSYNNDATQMIKKLSEAALKAHAKLNLILIPKEH
ncbi:MAG: hypothetical protein HOP04_13770 [Methylophilaceae bacterium]|nr:hypothetical protein [Methylophilaceae bacterium]